jgi:hypothetical protein
MKEFKVRVDVETAFSDFIEARTPEDAEALAEELVGNALGSLGTEVESYNVHATVVSAGEGEDPEDTEHEESS